MTSTMNKEFLEGVEKELIAHIMYFVATIEEKNAAQVAREMIGIIDWDNSALMHKGLSWMTKNYLMQKKML